MVSRRAEEVENLRGKTVSRLIGYLIAHQDALRSKQDALRLAPAAKVRRSFKQPCDILLQVPLFGRLAASLNTAASELERKLSTPAGQSLLLEFLTTKPALPHAPPQLSGEAWNHALSFQGIADVGKTMILSKTLCEMGGEAISILCAGTLVISPYDFPGSIARMVPFLHSRFLCETKVIDLRLVHDLSDPSFWVELCTLEALDRVLVSHLCSHPPWASQPFRVEVSLRG